MSGLILSVFFGLLFMVTVASIIRDGRSALIQFRRVIAQLKCGERTAAGDDE